MLIIDADQEMALPTRFGRVASAFAGRQSTYAARRGMALAANRKDLVPLTPATRSHPLGSHRLQRSGIR